MLRYYAQADWNDYDGEIYRECCWGLYALLLLLAAKWKILSVVLI